MAIVRGVAWGESFTFREPELRVYESEVAPAPEAWGGQDRSWIAAHPANAPSSKPVYFGSRVVIGIAPGGDLQQVLAGKPLTLSTRVAADLYIADASDAGSAMREADELARDPSVTLATPVVRKIIRKSGAYAKSPNDSYFHRQWHLENRDAGTGASTGPDLNVRSAWPFARGEGVLIAIADDGIDMDHLDLSANLAGGPHFNFVTREQDGNHRSALHAHGTAVAGLAAAVGGNRRGVSGVAPSAKLASWVIFDRFDQIVEDEALMNVFQYRSDIVGVQNHSWANSGPELLGPSAIEQVGISNAVHHGRGGLGVVIARAGGNARDDGANGNDDGYGADPQIITTGAVRYDGRVASYSTPGSNLLVAAPSGDNAEGQPSLFTTDRSGSLGYNNNAFTNDLADYGFDGSGFSGTSGAAPQISGIAALALSANKELTVRDVQQILVLASRQTDRFDPDLHGSGSGFRISHNTGFGVPDAGEVARLARIWKRRPALTEATASSTTLTEIPDDALRLSVIGPGVPEGLASIHANPGGWLHADEPTLRVPITDVGLASSAIGTDLRGRAALIMRGGNFFSEKIEFASAAGATFAVVYNNRDANRRILMSGVDFARIPSVFIGERDGRELSAFLASGQTAQARLSTTPAVVELTIQETLSCEHVLLTVDADHPRRGDLRITLVSPSGTRSVLQRVNSDVNGGPVQWAYMSTHHFFEPSAGVWRVEVTDEGAGNPGQLRSLALKILGVAIRDTDGDGLDDDWELRHFGNLDQTLTGDFDGDGFNHAREQAASTDPTRADLPFATDLSLWKEGVVRLSWPGLPRTSYEVLGAPAITGPFETLTNVAGRFPETEWFFPFDGAAARAFQLRRLTSP